MHRRHVTTALAASLGLAACRGDSSYSLIGKTLPSVQGLYLDGAPFDLPAIAKPAVIRFWGLWCGPCMIDMPNWLSVVRKMRSDTGQLNGLNIFTIHVGEAPANGPSLEQWAKDQSPDVATPIVNDATNAIMRAVGVTGTPSTVFVDAKGRIQEHAWAFKNARGQDSFIRKVVELKGHVRN